VTAIAREHNLNSGLVQRWVREHERKLEQLNLVSGAEIELSKPPDFVEIPFQSVSSVNGNIELELVKGDLKAKLRFHQGNVLECTHLIKALFRC
jgi:transposase-like protein